MSLLFGGREPTEDDCLCTPEGPDDMGNYDRLDHPDCPIHAPAPEPTMEKLPWYLAHEHHDDPYEGCPYCHDPTPPKMLWPAGPGEWQRLERTALELRDRGLSYPAIAVVFELYEGVEMDDRTMRAWLQRLGAPAVRPDLQRPEARPAGRLAA